MIILGWSPGLVIMGGDLYSKGYEFDSLYWVLEIYFSH